MSTGPNLIPPSAVDWMLSCLRNTAPTRNHYTGSMGKFRAETFAIHGLKALRVIDLKVIANRLILLLKKQHDGDPSPTATDESFMFRPPCASANKETRINALHLAFYQDSACTIIRPKDDDIWKVIEKDTIENSNYSSMGTELENEASSVSVLSTLESNVFQHTTSPKIDPKTNDFHVASIGAPLHRSTLLASVAHEANAVVSNQNTIVPSLNRLKTTLEGDGSNDITECFDVVENLNRHSAAGSCDNANKETRISALQRAFCRDTACNTIDPRDDDIWKVTEKDAIDNSNHLSKGAELENGSSSVSGLLSSKGDARQFTTSLKIDSRTKGFHVTSVGAPLYRSTLLESVAHEANAVVSDQNTTVPSFDRLTSTLEEGESNEKIDCVDLVENRDKLSAAGLHQTPRIGQHPSALAKALHDNRVSKMKIKQEIFFSGNGSACELRPRDFCESSMLAQMKFMGFTDDTEILTGLRHVEMSRNGPEAMTPMDHVEAAMMWIVVSDSRREEVDEARKLDAARMASEVVIMQERSSCCTDSYFETIKYAKIDAIIGKSGVGNAGQGSTRSLFFPSSVVLETATIKRLFCSLLLNDQNYENKTHVIRFLDLEKRAIKWYGTVAPFAYFKYVSTKRIESEGWKCTLAEKDTPECMTFDSKRFLNVIRNELTSLEKVLFTLSEQEQGGIGMVPRAFLRAREDAIKEGLPVSPDHSCIGTSQDEVIVLDSSDYSGRSQSATFMENLFQRRSSSSLHIFELNRKDCTLSPLKKKARTEVSTVVEILD